MANESQFKQRADNAALQLKGQLSKELGRELPSKQVLVDSDGRPPKPLPPEGSYMRQQIEQQRAQQQHAQTLGDQPLAGTVEQAIDGSQAPPLTPPGTDPQELAAPISDNANRRIQELTQKLRAQDQELQTALAEGKRSSESQTQLEQRIAAMEQEKQEILQANLDQMDPETRMKVLNDARMIEMFDGFKKQMMDSIMPHVEGLQQSNVQQQMLGLADVYPAFDLQVHGPLIDMFRGKNQHCTVEQAWKAVAEPEELVTRETARLAPAVPPVVPPGGGGAQPRYMPEPQTNPEQEMIEESQSARDLMRSDNPNDHKKGLRAFDRNIASRLAHKLPGSRPTYR